MISLFFNLTVLVVAVTSVNAGTLLRGDSSHQDQDQDGRFEVWQGSNLIYSAKAPNGHKNVKASGTIVQIGKKAWELVKNNEAVVDYDTDFCGAVPNEYAEDWSSLAGWSDVHSEQFRFHYKVGGDTVSELKWKYAWSAEGHDNDGIGHYVMNAGVHIDKLYARAGQNLKASVLSLAPLNYGTVEDPLAGIDIQVSFTSASAFNSATTTCTVTVRGDEKYEVKDCEGNDP